MKNNSRVIILDRFIYRRFILTRLPFSGIVFKKAFAMFDSGKTGSIEKEKIRTILNTLGHTYDDKELMDMLDQEDEEGKTIQI